MGFKIRGVVVSQEPDFEFHPPEDDGAGGVVFKVTHTNPKSGPPVTNVMAAVGKDGKLHIKSIASVFKMENGVGLLTDDNSRIRIVLD